ncbi:MAG TPA: hypothetical protein VKZ18_02800 [Polyangia bacterium]|nr:hypothetical protein [Polyangia bacterium]
MPRAVAVALLAAVAGLSARVAVPAPDVAATGAGADAGVACPVDEAIERALGISGAGWQVACTPTGGGLALAALSCPDGRAEAPHLVVEIAGQRPARFEIALVGDEGERIRAVHADAWRLAVAPARIPGVDWLRIDAVGEGGAEYVFAQTLVWFFRPVRDRLIEEWAGLGDRTEVRFDACRLETHARFSLAPDGRLVRELRGRSWFSNPGGLANGELAPLRRRCTAGEPTRDLFSIVRDE